MAQANFVISGRTSPTFYYHSVGNQARVSVFGNHVDGFSEEQHDKSVQVTENPVESGSTITDSATTNPDHLRLEGWVSDLIPRAGPVPVNLSDRSALAWGIIEDMADNHQIVQVVTGIKTYNSMLLSTASTVRNARTGGGLRFTLNMKSLRIVDTQLRTIRLSPENVTGPIVDRTTTVDAGEKDSPDIEGDDMFLPWEPWIEQVQETGFEEDFRLMLRFISNQVFKLAKPLKEVAQEAYNRFTNLELVNEALTYFGVELDVFESDIDPEVAIKRIQSRRIEERIRLWLKEFL